VKNGRLWIKEFDQQPYHKPRWSPYRGLELAPRKAVAAPLRCIAPMCLFVWHSQGSFAVTTWLRPSLLRPVSHKSPYHSTGRVVTPSMLETAIRHSA
jgi:hypothetical protein